MLAAFIILIASFISLINAQMKYVFTLLLVFAGLSLHAQSTRAPGTVIGNPDSVSWNNTVQYKGSKFRLVSGGTVVVNHLEARQVGPDTCIYAVSQSGRYYAMNPAAERVSGGNYAYEHFNFARPTNELGASLFDAGRSLRNYQSLKIASFGSGLASVMTLVLAAQANSGNGGPGTGVYLVSGALAGTSLVLSMLADGQVHRAGRLLQIASGRINIGR